MCKGRLTARYKLQPRILKLPLKDPLTEIVKLMRNDIPIYVILKREICICYRMFRVE